MHGTKAALLPPCSASPSHGLALWLKYAQPN